MIFSMQNQITGINSSKKADFVFKGSWDVDWEEAGKCRVSVGLSTGETLLTLEAVAFLNGRCDRQLLGLQ